MHIRYKGEEDGDMVCTVFSVTFPAGEWVEVSGEVAKRLAGNPMFDADPLDLDQNGERGGSEASDSLEPLREELRSLGVKFHPRTGRAKLEALLEDARK